MEFFEFMGKVSAFILIVGAVAFVCAYAYCWLNERFERKQ